MSLLEMPFKDNIAGASLFALSYLLLLLLVILLFGPPVIYLVYQIKQKFRLLLSKRRSRDIANKKRIVAWSGLQPDIHGMDNHVIKAIEFLERSTSSLLGIHGVRRVGKTTLLRLLRDTCALNDSSFDYILYAGAGVGCSVASLQRVLAIQIGLVLPLYESNISSAKIISRFLRDKSFVLLLDDVWESIDLAAISLPVPLGHQQKVIFTTRNQSVCNEMGCGINTIQMQCLEEDVAWDLFRYNVWDNKIIDYDPEVKELAKQIVAECRGFPGALSFVGRTMSIKRDFKDWRVARDDMLTKNRPLPNGIQDADDEGYPCLQLFEDAFF